MASIILNISDESLLTQIKKACMLLKGVTSVKVQKNLDENKDVTKTAGFKAAMKDIEAGRVSCYNSVDDLFNELGIDVK
ncbi:MAG: hypothetical protein J5957_10330 [Prevotella sp.]|nr:hypothetical protein [Prevotella sp.]